MVYLSCKDPCRKRPNKMAVINIRLSESRALAVPVVGVYKDFRSGSELIFIRQPTQLISIVYSLIMAIVGI